MANGGDQTNSGGRAQECAEWLRARIYAQKPGERIGSLRSLAEEMGVGIVSVQQAARVLEHEGLLEVRRGPTGGYYGARPDAASLERALSAYLRTYPIGWEEVLDVTSLLFIELAAAACQCTDEDSRRGLENFLNRIEKNVTPSDIGLQEAEFQDILMTMVNRPLFELLTRVALRFSEDWGRDPLHRGTVDAVNWRVGRCNIIAAILNRDTDLARFEAERFNRRFILEAITQGR